MDDRGRLHMPGFVGQTFEETGIRMMPKDKDDESARQAVEGAEFRAGAELGNRKSRRAMEFQMRPDRRQGKQIAR